MAVINPFDFFLEPDAEHFPFDYDPGLEQELAPFQRVDPPGRLLSAWLAEVPRDRKRTIDFLVGLTPRLAREITYLIRMEPGVQTAAHPLQNKSGSSRDTSWPLVPAQPQPP